MKSGKNFVYLNKLKTNKVMNYEHLLYKYMMHVDITEGTDFTCTLNEERVKFTDKEIKELKEIVKKIKLSYKNDYPYIKNK